MNTPRGRLVPLDKAAECIYFSADANVPASVLPIALWDKRSL